MIDNLKIELGIEDARKDTLLQRLLDKATGKVMDITHRTDGYVKANLSDTVIDLAVIMYNRRGTEGATSTSASGMSESYLNDIPQDIKKTLYAHRKLGGAK